MKKFINRIVSDRIMLLGSIMAILFLLISVGLVAFFYHRLPPYIPLFHQVPWGIGRLGNKIEFFLPGSYVFSTIVINLVFASTIYEKMPLVSRIIIITNVLLSSILLLFTIRTLQLVM